MMGEAGIGKTGHCHLYFLPFGVTAVSTLLLSEMIAKFTQLTTVQNNSSNGIPFWNLNIMFMGEISVYVFLAVVVNNESHMYLYEIGCIINILKLTFLTLSNPKVSQT